MERRNARIGLIIFVTALIVGVVPVIPVGEVLAPERSAPSTQTASLEAGIVPMTGVSPLADATTLEKLRHLFSR